LKKGQDLLQAAAAAEHLGGCQLGTAARAVWGRAAEAQSRSGRGRGRRLTEAQSGSGSQQRQAAALWHAGLEAHRVERQAAAG
jgi:hypothetical protein